MCDYATPHDCSSTAERVREEVRELGVSVGDVPTRVRAVAQLVDHDTQLH